MQFTISACTDVGNSKNMNQDSLNAMIANTKQGQAAMAVVCDGIGGLSGGEIASAYVVTAFKKWFSEGLPSLLGVPFFQEKLEEQWRRVIQDVNNKILCHAAEKHFQMGTTLTAILLADGSYYIAQIGDSRAYEITEQLQQLTKDQTLTQREVLLGHITSEQARCDSRKHVLLQCIGTNQTPEPEFLSGKIPEGAAYLLCTDGFYNRLTEQEIYEKCNRLINFSQDCMEEHLQDLILCCKDRGEQDNISAILLQTRS